MQQAFNFGLFNVAKGSIAPSSPTCSSWNCTWPLYNSLAVCSKVANVSSFLSNTTIYENMLFNISSNTTNYPRGVSLTLPNRVYLEYILSGTVMNITTPWTPDANIGKSLAFKNEPYLDNTTIINSFVVWGNDGYTSAGRATYGAIEVVFHWCVNTYNTLVHKGVATRSISATSNTVLTTSGSFSGTNGTPEGYTYTGALVLQPENTSYPNANYTVDDSTNNAMNNYMCQRYGIYDEGIAVNYPSNAVVAFTNSLFK
jgi:hypothetical protein